jgi:hypothetical protein
MTQRSLPRMGILRLMQHKNWLKVAKNNQIAKAAQSVRRDQAQSLHLIYTQPDYSPIEIVRAEYHLCLRTGGVIAICRGYAAAHFVKAPGAAPPGAYFGRWRDAVNLWIPLSLVSPVHGSPRDVVFVCANCVQTTRAILD